MTNSKDNWTPPAQPWYRQGKFIYPLLVILIASGLISFELDNKPVPTNEVDKTVYKPPVKTEAHSVEYIKWNTIKASTLYDDYDKNEVKADRQYKGKTIYVKGRITDIKKSVFDKMYIVMETNKLFGSVQCYIDNEDVLVNLSKGQLLTVKGTCTGLFGTVAMEECVVIDCVKD